MVVKLIILIALLFIGIIISYWVYKDECSDTPKLNHKENCIYGKKLASMMIFLVISSALLLLFQILYNSSFFVQFIGDWKYGEAFYESGLYLTLLLFVVGYLVKLACFLLYKLYKIFCKVSKKIPKTYIRVLKPEEKKWILILGLFVLISTGIKSKDYNIVFSSVVIILGKFLWIDADIKSAITELKELKQLPVNVLLSFGAFMVYIVSSFFVDTIWSQFYFMNIVMGYLLGIGLLDKKLDYN